MIILGVLGVPPEGNTHLLDASRFLCLIFVWRQGGSKRRPEFVDSNQGLSDPSSFVAMHP